MSKRIGSQHQSKVLMEQISMAVLDSTKLSQNSYITWEYHVVFVVHLFVNNSYFDNGRTKPNFSKRRLKLLNMACTIVTLLFSFIVTANEKMQSVSMKKIWVSYENIHVF